MIKKMVYFHVIAKKPLYRANYGLHGHAYVCDMNCVVVKKGNFEDLS